MSEKKHTPGPWIVGDCGHIEAIVGRDGSGDAITIPVGQVFAQTFRSYYDLVTTTSLRGFEPLNNAI